MLTTDFMNFSLHRSPHSATRDLLEVFLSGFFFLWLMALETSVPGRHNSPVCLWMNVSF